MISEPMLQALHEVRSKGVTLEEIDEVARSYQQDRNTFSVGDRAYIYRVLKHYSCPEQGMTASCHALLQETHKPGGRLQELRVASEQVERQASLKRSEAVEKAGNLLKGGLWFLSGISTVAGGLFFPRGKIQGGIIIGGGLMMAYSLIASIHYSISSH
ncbi:MAG: hypothetical protein HYW02_05810 [Deltaproteobacteria bacterium]|nr:hypothetical protein [Deltaproteobacteria bacterium]MBI2500970.1 hypothetical protein [Deltaproteobacteria bacterium]